MRWLFALALLVGSSFYLWDRYRRLDAAPPPRISSAPEPPPLLSLADIQKVRRSASDPDPGVRLAALALLLSIQDPKGVELASKAAADDLDTEVKLKAIALLKAAEEKRLAERAALARKLRAQYDEALKRAKEREQ